MTAVRLDVPDRIAEDSSHRLHKPGVAGSSPAAAIPHDDSVRVCHTPAEVYHKWPETSCSQLKELAASPVAYYLRYVAGEAPPKSSASLSFGTLLHLWAEVGEATFWDRVAIAPADCVTAAGQFGKAAEAWKQTLPEGAVPVSPADHSQLWAQTRQILRNEAAAELLSKSIDAEFNVRWNWHGHSMRCRCDGATPSCWYDLKTTRESNPLDTFWKSVDTFGYDLQAAIYGAASIAAGWPYHSLRFIVTSNIWPHHCAVVTLPDAVVQRGRTRALALLSELQQRREWDSWFPSDYGQVHELYCPQFMHERV